MTEATPGTLPKPPRRTGEEVSLPHYLEAERACLGAALVHAAACDWVCDHLTIDCFFRDAHRQIFTAIREVRSRGVQADFITVRAELERKHKVDDAGGLAYVAGLSDGIPKATNVQYYGGILHDLRVKRALVMFAERTIDFVAAGEHRSTELLGDADRRLLEISKGWTSGRMLSLRDTANDRFAALEWRTTHKGELRGIHTGYREIDKETLGWRSADLIILAARPSIGKTTLALNSSVLAAQTVRKIKGVATDQKLRIGIFSLEMRREQLEDRILSQLSGVPLTRIQTGEFGSAEYGKVSHALEMMSDLQIEIDDRAGQSAIDIRGACRRMMGDGGLDMVVVDYVQQMPGTLARRGANRNEEITDISMRLKDLADEVSAPILLLSQLRRVEGRPKLEDLRECGALEQAADVVLLLYRKDHRVGGPTECIIAKQRNGPTGTVWLSMDRETTTFSDGEAPSPEAVAEERVEEQQASRRKHFALKRRRG